MTAHEFAHQLLAGPDLPILVPKVVEYSDDDENSCALPVVSEIEGCNTITEEPCRVLVIDSSLRKDTGEMRIRNPHPAV